MIFSEQYNLFWGRDSHLPKKKKKEVYCDHLSLDEIWGEEGNFRNADQNR